ncbi:ATP-binding cassette domain-containing protein [Clostridium hydrogeniformans]|uniref:ATP-binding cassette domain-containing protein n=1 Tax=Clostridium hydrogeniformans TaxID=349933 RepID=UPI0004833F7D|nr:ABC transporter ATP-binding protein [Clostridium hydrogeniformans]
MDKRNFVLTTTKKLKMNIISTIIYELTKQLLTIYIVLVTGNVANMILSRDISALKEDALKIVLATILSLILIPSLRMVEVKYMMKNGVAIDRFTFKNFLRNDKTLIDKYEKGDLIYRLEMDPINYRFNIHFLISYSLVYLTIIFITLGFMIKINMIFSIICLLLSTTPILLDFFLMSKIRKLNREDNDHLSEISGEEKSMVDNILFIQSQDIKNEVIESFKKAFKSYYKFLSKKLTTEKALREIKEYYKTACTITIYFIGSYMVSKNMLTIPDVIKFLGFSMVLKDNTYYLNDIVQYFIKFHIYLDRMIELTKNEEGGNTFLTTINSLEIKDLSFSYSNKEVFKNLNLSIFKGERIILQGENGSGKSTLSKLLTAIYKDFQGEILLNNIPIKNINLASLRSEIIITSQFPFILDKTVEENILYLAHEDLKYKTKEVMNILSLNEIKDKKTGYNGNLLSGGQRQKISLAHAMVSKASLIILDEPDTALDYTTREKVKEYFNSIDSTLIVITHDSGWMGRNIILKAAQ